MTVEFAKGFIRACDEAGMDAEAVIKHAQQLLQPAVAPAPAAPAPIQAPASAPAAAAPSTPTITGAAAPTPQGPVPVPAPAAPEPSAGKFMPPVRRYGQDLNAFNSQIGQQQRIQGYSGAGSQALGMKTSSVKGSKVMQTQSTVKSASVKSVMAFIKSMLSGAGNHVAELAGAAAGVSPRGGGVWRRFKAPFVKGNRLLRSAHSRGLGVGHALHPRLIGEALGSTAVAASPAALVTSALMDKNSAFLEGFQLKCAELNLDPVKLYKQALYVPGFGPVKGRNWDLSWVPGHERYAAYNRVAGSMPVTGGNFGEDLHEKLTTFRESLTTPGEGEVTWSGGPRERRLALLRTQSRRQAFKNENDQMLADAEAVLARLQQKGRDIANPPAKSTPQSSFAERMYAMNRGNIESWNKSPVAPRPVRLSPELLRSVTAPSAPYVPPPALPPALQRQLAKNVAGAGAPQLVSALPPDLA